MLKFEKNEKRIYFLARNFSDNKRNEFFINIFNKFNKEDQAQIIQLFENTMRSSRKDCNSWNLFLRKNPFTTESIEKEIDFPNFLYNNELNNNAKLIFINLYLNIKYYTASYLSHEDENSMLKTIIDYLNDNEQNYENANFIAILSTIFKNINEKTISKLKEDSYYEQLENAVIKYIENIDINELCNSTLLNVLIEISPSINIDRIYNKINQKISAFELENEKDKNFEEHRLIIQRIKNRILPKNICNLILQNESAPIFYRRIATVDYIRNILLENGIANCIVIYDDQITMEGLASTNKIRIQCDKLNLTCFHEIIHIFQDKDIMIDKRYPGNRYSMLKDLILGRMVGFNIYRQNYSANESSWLHEKEAEELGQLEYQKHFGTGTYKEVKLLDTVVINGDVVQKKELFNELIKQNKDFLEKFPILQIEYNQDGTKKNDEDIMIGIQQRFSTTEDVEEKNGIYNCIFNNTHDKSLKDSESNKSK